MGLEVGDGALESQDEQAPGEQAEDRDQHAAAFQRGPEKRQGGGGEHDPGGEPEQRVVHPAPEVWHGHGSEASQPARQPREERREQRLPRLRQAARPDARNHA